jgi:hypothetical protein
MGLYVVTRPAFTLSPGVDFLAVVSATAPSSRKLIWKELVLSGLGAALAANEIVVALSTGGSGGAALTRSAAENDLEGAVFTARHTDSVAATLASREFFRGGINAIGSLIYRPLPRAGEIRAGEQLSFRCVAGTSQVAMTAVFEEP